jgi:tetratricopeptide (TPR) repeat protein
MKYVVSAFRRTVIMLALAVPASAQSPAPAPGRSLVLPFENAGREPRVFWLGEGSAVLLTDDLAALGVPAVSREERRRGFDRLGVAAVTALSHATAIRVGQAAGASRVVIGGFELSMGELTVRARAILIDSGRIGPEIAERGPLADIFGIYARVARRLAPDSRVSLEDMERGHPPLPAFELYVKGLLAEAPAARLSFLSQVLRLAPAFQQARLALWRAHTDQNEHQRALTVARQVPADHRLARSAQFLASISLLELSRHQDAFDAMTVLQRAAADAAVANNLGVLQLRRPVAAPGGQAVTFFEEARRLDPADPDILFNLGYAYWLAKDVIQATAWLREAVRRRPSDAAAHYALGVALQWAGNTTEGAREKDLGKRGSPDLLEWDVKNSGAIVTPRGMERIKAELSLSAAP